MPYVLGGAHWALPFHVVLRFGGGAGEYRRKIVPKWEARTPCVGCGQILSDLVGSHDLCKPFLGEIIECVHVHRSIPDLHNFLDIYPCEIVRRILVNDKAQIGFSLKDSLDIGYASQEPVESTDNNIAARTISGHE
jgi:hypothetical protein